MRAPIYNKVLIMISIFIIISFIVLFFNKSINNIGFCLGVFSQVILIIQQIVFNKRK